MKTMELGICLVAISTALVYLTNINEYLSNKILFIPTQLEMGRDAGDNIIPIPIPQDDGIIRLMAASELEKDDDGNIILSPDQVLNFEKLGSLDEPLYSFPVNAWSKSGSIKIDNGQNSSIKIEIRLKSITRLHFHYIGSYETSGDKMKLLSASCNTLGFYRFLFTFVLGLLLFIIGVALITIAIIRKIWPPPPKYSFLESHDALLQ